MTWAEYIARVRGYFERLQYESIYLRHFATLMMNKPGLSKGAHFSPQDIWSLPSVDTVMPYSDFRRVRDLKYKRIGKGLKWFC